jgi:hypothetical protein
VTNILSILQVILLLEGGQPTVSTEHSAYHLSDAAIADVHALYPAITVEDVDTNPVAAKFCAGEYWKILRKRLKKKLGREPTMAEVGAAYNAGYEGWKRGRGRKYGEQLNNLMEK